MHRIDNLIKNVSNLFGFFTNRKIVVIESDDWGSIRMNSLESFEKLKAQGVKVDKGQSVIYNTNDSLATADDLSSLFSVLNSHKDSHQRSSVFTALAVVANPDFERIREDDFRNYYYESFTETLKRQKGCEHSFDLWKEGINNGLFVPQFHAREHLNVQEWMRQLQADDRDTLLAFNEHCWGFNRNFTYQAAFDFIDPVDLKYQAETIRTGLILFEKLFGYKAQYFVPANGPFSRSLEKVAAEFGIEYLYASKMQIEPVGYGKHKRVLHYLGQRNKHDQLYMTRNCFFEPVLKGQDWIDSCLSDVSFAFKYHKPAIISSHRVNYIGALNPSNRDAGLRNLDILLRTIVKKWPDVEFMTSTELGDLMSKKPIVNIANRIGVKNI